MRIFFWLLCVFAINFTQAQDTIPKAIITTQTVNSVDMYSFKSNFYIPDWKAPMLENRMKKRYSELKTITIDAQTQLVTISLHNGIDTNTFISKFVSHFKYSGYEMD